jgi:hypothetical protein
MKGLARRLVLGGIAIVTLAAPSMIAAQPAQAYTCNGSRTITVNSSTGVASATVTISPNCSDGKAHWSGSVRDTKCDARSARVAIYGNVVGGPLGNESQWSHGYSADNGCGTGASFSGSDSALGSRWNMYVDVVACNTSSCSSHTWGSVWYNS